MKAFYFDFNGTLETGSEFSLTRAINETLREMGIGKRYKPEELLEHFGKPLDEIVKPNIPVGIDTDYFIRRIQDKDLIYSKKHIRPNDGAETLIHERCDRFIILSLVSRKLLNAFLEKYNLNNYVGSIVWEDMAKAIEKLRLFAATPMHDFNVSQEGYQFLCKTLKELPSTEEEFKAYQLYFGARSWYSDLTVMIGDAYEDMSAANKANELLAEEYRIKKHRKSVISVLFDPDETKPDIPCDYRIRKLPEVLGLFY